VYLIKQNKKAYKFKKRLKKHLKSNEIFKEERKKVLFLVNK